MTKSLKTRHRPVQQLILSIFFVSSLVAMECQSYPAGLRALCDAPKACMNASTDQRMMIMAKHIAGVVSNEEMETLFQKMSAQSMTERATGLKAAMAKAALNDCALADEFTKAAKSGQ